MSDDQELKSVLSEEFKDLESALSAPGQVDPSLRKRVDSFILRNLHILVMRNTVTETECRLRMGACVGACEAHNQSDGAAHKQSDGAAQTPAAVVPPASFSDSSTLSQMLFKDAMKWVPTPVLLFVFMVGKGKGWW